MKRTRTWPFCVRASAGSIRPSVVVKVMTVPFCTGVPAPDDDVDGGRWASWASPGSSAVVGVVGVVAVVPFSMAVATISISPLSGTVFDVAKIEMTVPPGARSGTLSHAESEHVMGSEQRPAQGRRGPSQADGLDCASIEKPKDSNFMGLRGQVHAERGYAMAALLVALAIMAILLTVAMPVWRHQAQREKEAELVFRGEQYARAIALFRFKNANIPNAFPPSIDSLVQGRFLRKKYKDPMTKDGEFVLIGVGSAATRHQRRQPATRTPPGAGRQPPQPASGSRQHAALQPTGQVAGGMMGVRSKSTETSIRAYRGATRYDQWPFTFNIAPRPGGAMPMANTPDGGRGSNPTNPNVPPGGGRRTARRAPDSAGTPRADAAARAVGPGGRRRRFRTGRPRGSGPGGRGGRGF